MIVDDAQLGWLISAIFVGCLCALIGSLVYSLRDIDLTLRALALEVNRES
jgi:hypothetical protein